MTARVSVLGMFGAWLHQESGIVHGVKPRRFFEGRFGGVLATAAGVLGLAARGISIRRGLRTPFSMAAIARLTGWAKRRGPTEPEMTPLRAFIMIAP